MKKSLVFTVTIFLSLLLAFPGFAQRGYDKLGVENDVLIQYRWQRENIFDRHSNAVLNLRLTNESEEARELVFTIAFYRDEQIMFESTGNSICLEPGQSRRGGGAGLRFSSEGISRDMTEEEWFSWDILWEEINPVVACD